jgi:hypothetical protein
MADGLRVKNSAGIIVLDELSALLQFYTKGTAYTETSAPFFSDMGRCGLYVDLPSTLVAPLIAFTGSIVVAKVDSYVVSPGVVRHQFQTDMEFSGQPVTYYVFAKIGSFTAPMSGGGLRLKDAAGNITFEANAYMARVVTVLNTTTSIAVPSGKTYAVAQGVFAGSRNQINPDGGERLQFLYLIGGYGGRSGQAGFEQFQVQNGIAAGEAPNFSIPLGFGIVFDVTPFA